MAYYSTNGSSRSGAHTRPPMNHRISQKTIVHHPRQSDYVGGSSFGHGISAAANIGNGARRDFRHRVAGIGDRGKVAMPKGPRAGESNGANGRNISAVDLSQRLPSAITNDELDDLGRAFNDLLDRLQISFQRQQRFTAEASHQLRTPLAAMLGQVDVALRRDRSADEYRRALQSVQRQAEQLKQIIEMLLFLAREDSEAAVPSWNDGTPPVGCHSTGIVGATSAHCRFTFRNQRRRPVASPPMPACSDKPYTTCWTTRSVTANLARP